VIQSIGVIRRDLEGDTSYGLGHVFFPAFLFHGSFDFVLMILTGLNSLHLFEEIVDYDTVQKQSNKKHVQKDTSDDNMLSLPLSSTILVLSIVYYVAQARAQHKRMMDLVLSVQKRTS